MSKQGCRISIVLLCAITAGCSTTATFTTGYTVPPPTTAAPQSGSLAVRVFDDQRPARIYTTAGRAFLTYVPLIPYVTLDFERLDATVPLLSAQIEHPGEVIEGAAQNRAPAQATYAYPESMAKAVAADLAARGYFREVDYVGERTDSEHDYVLDGSLRATPLQRSITSFCLGLPGVYLWLLPIPMSKTTAGVTLDLKLTERRSGRIVWSAHLTPEASQLDNLYTSPGLLYGGGHMTYEMVRPPAATPVDRDSLFAWHFEALRRGMADAAPSLGAALTSQP